MIYRLSQPDRLSFMVVGCGGTGGFVAEGLCRMFAHRGMFLALIDHDTVEDRNLRRQNFYHADLGRFKSQVLAERLSKQYGIKVNYGTEPIEKLSVDERCTITIGCVDNPAARVMLQYAGYNMGGRTSYENFGGWYIDTGNDEYTGQVMIGNQLGHKTVRQSFHALNGRCYRLPLPQVQEPGLLIPTKKPERSCAEAVEADEQSPVINQAMANLVLTFVDKLFKGTLEWMRAYIDLERGSLTTVPVTPEVVSRITGDTVKQLEYRPRDIKKGNLNIG